MQRTTSSNVHLTIPPIIGDNMQARGQSNRDAGMHSMCHPCWMCRVGCTPSGDVAGEVGGEAAKAEYLLPPIFRYKLTGGCAGIKPISGGENILTAVGAGKKARPTTASYYGTFITEMQAGIPYAIAVGGWVGQAAHRLGMRQGRSQGRLEGKLPRQKKCCTRSNAIQDLTQPGGLDMPKIHFS